MRPVCVVHSDFLDLFGDIGDCGFVVGSFFGFGAFGSEPEGDEYEEEDDGGSDTNAEDDP